MIPGAALILVAVASAVPVFFIVMWVVGTHNRLVTLRHRYQEAYAQVEVELKRRDDLIPEVIETAKGYLQKERGALEAVLAARNAALAAHIRAAQVPGDTAAMKDLSGAEIELAGTLARLFSVVEAYPDLKAGATMTRLKAELTSAESKVAGARQAYNDAAMNYNTVREVFPTNVIAGPFSFGPAGLLITK